MSLSDGVIALLVTASCLVYWRAWRRGRLELRPLPGKAWRSAVAFGMTMLILATAFGLPAGTVMTQMVEHVLLAFAIPPLLFLGVPRSLLLPLFAGRRSRHLIHALTRPTRAAGLFLVVLFVWYLPAAFDAALRYEVIRWITGISILATALLFWWPVLEPFPSWHGELAHLGKLLYLFFASSVLKVLGFILALMPRPMYRLPYPGRPLWGITVLQDQQYAGWLMVAAGTFVLLAAATVVCAQLLRDPSDQALEDAEVRARRGYLA